MQGYGKIVIVGILVMLAFIGIASAASVVPEKIDGNPTCGPTYIGFKVESDEFMAPTNTGTYYVDAAKTKFVTITTYCVDPSLNKVACGADDDPNAFDWTSNFPVDEVIVKGADAANKFVYGGSMGDFKLYAPLKNDKYPGLSHVDFCLTPEFPTVAIPIGMIIGLFGIVTLVRGKKE